MRRRRHKRRTVTGLRWHDIARRQLSAGLGGAFAPWAGASCAGYRVSPFRLAGENPPATAHETRAPGAMQKWAATPRLSNCAIAQERRSTAQPYPSPRSRLAPLLEPAKGLHVDPRLP